MGLVLLLAALIALVVTWVVIVDARAVREEVAREGFWFGGPRSTDALKRRSLPAFSAVPRGLRFADTSSLQPFSAEREIGTKWKWSELLVKSAYSAAFDGQSSTHRDVLRWVLSRGVRCVHLEVFRGEHGLPIVGVSPNALMAAESRIARDVVRLTDVMKVLATDGFATGITPNATDPLIVVLQLQTTGETLDEMASRVSEVLSAHATRRFATGWTNDTPFEATRQRLLVVIESSHPLSAAHALRQSVNAVANEGFVQITRDRGPWTTSVGDSRAFTIALPIGNPHAGVLTQLFQGKTYMPPTLKRDLTSHTVINAVAVPYFRADALRTDAEALFERARHAWIPRPMLEGASPLPTPSS